MNVILTGIRELQPEYSIVKKQRVLGLNKKNKYRLLEDLNVQLSNDDIINIKQGFIWDGSSVPRFLWWLLPPDGDFELASLIHDYLYINKNNLNYTRKFADKEMLVWSNVLSGTQNKISIRNIDNYTRYIFVRLFGGFVWKDVFKIK